MAECLVCGKSFDPMEGRHTCASLYGAWPAAWDKPADVPRTEIHPHLFPEAAADALAEAMDVTRVSGYLQEAQDLERSVRGEPLRFEQSSEAEPWETTNVWTWSHAGKGMAGRVCFMRAELPRDRQAMRALLHERLQVLGDALLVKWEKLIREDEGGC